jgi:hypothetical protein
MIGGGVERRFDGVDELILDLQMHLATHPTIWTCRAYDSVGDDHGRSPFNEQSLNAKA